MKECVEVVVSGGEEMWRRRLKTILKFFFKNKKTSLLPKCDIFLLFCCLLIVNILDKTSDLNTITLGFDD